MGDIENRLRQAGPVLTLAACLAWAAASTALAAGPRLADGFSFAAGGDLLGPYQPLGHAPDAALQAVAKHFRDADLGYANVEGSIFDPSTFKGWPAAETGGGYPLAPAAVAQDLRGLGITVVSKANNHATDYGTEGLVATLGSLGKAGVAQAGAGLDLAKARAPVYLATRNGIAALVSAASTFTPMSVAGQERRYGRYLDRGRPGISALHVLQVHLLPQRQLDILRSALAGLHVSSPEQAWSGELGSTVIGETAGPELGFGGVVFRAAPERALGWEMDPDDLHAVLDSIGQARRKAGFVLFSLHAHEVTPMTHPAGDDRPDPPADFETSLFHQAIDAGADAVVRSGPHELGGIEIYQGRPVFYGLGSLFFQFGGIRSYQVPGGDLVKFPDAWFQAIVPVTRYEHGRASEIRLYPVVTESSRSGTDGRPRPADAATGKEILERVSALSAPYGTRIAIVGGVGIIDLAGTSRVTPTARTRLDRPPQAAAPRKATPTQ